jgi:hypothetical protein
MGHPGVDWWRDVEGRFRRERPKRQIVSLCGCGFFHVVNGTIRSSGATGTRPPGWPTRHSTAMRPGKAAPGATAD